MRVPWVHLPKVKAMAPEFYDHLHAHRSLTRVLLQWIFDRKLDLYTRITRERDGERRSIARSRGDLDELRPPPSRRSSALSA